MFTDEAAIATAGMRPEVSVESGWREIGLIARLIVKAAHASRVEFKECVLILTDGED